MKDTLYDLVFAAVTRAQGNQEKAFVKWLCNWLSLVMSLMVSFLCLFSTRCLG